MATRKAEPNSFALALDVDDALQKYLPELGEIANQSKYVVGIALLYRGFISLSEDEFPRSDWDFLFQQIMDRAEAAARGTPRGE